MVGLHPGRESGDFFPRDTEHAATSSAHQMEMFAISERVVRRRPIGEVGMPNQAEFVEQFQGSVDGREVDPITLHVGEDLVWGGMTQLLDCLKNPRTLRRKPVAAAAQAFAPVRGFRHGATGREYAIAAVDPRPPCQRHTSSRR